MSRHGAVLVCLAMAALSTARALGQAARSAPPTGPKTAGTIRLNLPDNVELKVLADYVSERLGMNILYDEQAGKKRITVKAPAEIPKESLLGLLQSALKMNDLVLAEADQPGWKKIVPARDLTTVTREILPTGTKLPPKEPLAAITQVIKLEHITPQDAEQVLKPFLTQPGANTFVIRDQPLLIVTDYAHNFPRLLELVRLADRPGPAMVTKFVTAKHVESSNLAADVTRLLSEKYRHVGRGGRAVQPLPTVFALERTNQVVSIGTEAQTKEIEAMVKSLDVAMDMVTEVYQFQAASPERVEKLAKELIDPSVLKHRYRSSVDREAGILIVTAPASVHKEIASLKRDLDVIAEGTISPIRFYKLMNATAAEVLATIQLLRGGKGGLSAIALPQRPRPSATGLSAPVPGANLPPSGVGQELPKPPAYKESSQDGTSGSEGTLKPIVRTVQTEEATVTADTNTNTIIVVASPAVHRVYEQLIKMLDKRRPQVLVEATLVTLDTSGGFALGVEILHEGSDERHRYLTFSSFGLSTVDTAAGSLTLKPGVGFNGALISPDTVDVIIKALESSGRAKVISAPRILVNDNADGTLESIAEAPFTSVNASDTVATTSFAGYAQAGTTISVTPHISEGDHLQLNYSVTLSSFSGEGGAGIPPPRQSNTISSEVTVPNGYAVIVGGLKRHDFAETGRSLPLLGRIPIVKYLFGDWTESESESTLYVFIRPIILRDDTFEDLKYLSEQDLARAGLAGHYPRSEPSVME